MTANVFRRAAACWRRGVVRLSLAGLLCCGAALTPAAAWASDDLGVPDAGGDTDGPRQGIQPTTTPDNLGCSTTASARPLSSTPALLGMLGILVALGYRQRRARKRVVLASLVAVGLGATPAMAQPLPPPPAPSVSAPATTQVVPQPQVALYRPEGKRRHFTITYNPLTLLLSRYGGNLEVMLASHHVLVGTLYYAYTHTNEDSNNVFRGLGGEVGYRFYFGKDGPRGLYLGPSFLVGHFDAIPQLGPTINYWNYGAALDLGFQYLVADRVTLGIGGGVQYTVPTVDFPAQELPASIYAIRGVRPRLLLALGVAF